MNRAIGFDLGLKFTGYGVFDEGNRLVARGVIRPPAYVEETQDAACIIVDEAVRLIQKYSSQDGAAMIPPRVFREAPIVNAWGERGGQRVNMTSAETALSKGMLIGTFNDRLRQRRVRVDAIGIKRWRAILGLTNGPKEQVIKELEEWLAARGVRFERGTKEDEKEACGVACAGLVAIRDPRVLEPNWKRPKRAMFTEQELERAAKTGGLFDGD